MDRTVSRNMIYPVPETLEGVDNTFALVVTAAKRARQLVQGAPKLVDSDSTNPLTVALEELAQGAIIALHAPEPEIVVPDEALLDGADAPIAAISSIGVISDDDTSADIFAGLDEVEDDEEPETLDVGLARSLLGGDLDEESEDTADEDEDHTEAVEAEEDDPEQAEEAEPSADLPVAD